MEMESLVAIKYFDKETLSKAVDVAIERDYNRCINPSAVNELPDGFVFPVAFSMVHEHAAGVAVDPHMRAMIVINGDGDTVLLDVDMGLYNSLPTTEIETPV
jgi:hypothetical protein